MNELTKRILSSVVAGIILLLVFIFAPVKGLYILSMAAIFIGFIEYLSATGFRKELKKLSPFIILIFLPIIIFKNLPITILFILAFIIILFTGVLWLNRSNQEVKTTFKSLCCLLIGVFYCLICPLFVIQFIGTKQGNLLFIGLLLIVFSSDIFAYIGGRIFGKTPFMPNVSPKKSIEGSITGCLMALLVSILYFAYLDLPQFNIWIMIAATVPIAFIAQTGDLFASLIKRVYNIKDFGQIMPGHGGVLDRLDGLYFAAPVYWLTLYLMTNLSF